VPARRGFADKRISRSTDCAKDWASPIKLVVSSTPWHFEWWRPSKRTGRCVAEEMEKVNPDLGNRDCDGKVQTVPDGAVDATFLKEFLRERRRVEELGAKIVRQQKEIEALTAALQKMSAQPELTRPAPQTVASNQ